VSCGLSGEFHLWICAICRAGATERGCASFIDCACNGTGGDTRPLRRDGTGTERPCGTCSVRRNGAEFLSADLLSADVLGTCFSRSDPAADRRGAERRIARTRRDRVAGFGRGRASAGTAAAA
jgi:hypothetical protein